MTEATATKQRGVEPLDQTPQFEAFKGFVVANIGNNEASLDDMAAAVGVSKFALTRIVKKYGKEDIKSPVNFLWNERVKAAHEFLQANPEAKIQDVYPKFGFGSAQHFSRVYRDTFNETPSATQTRSKVI